MSKSYTVTNITPENQAFDDKTLRPNQSVVVSGLTDDLLAAWFVDRVSISPEPDKIDWATRVMCINPSQLPLPVRMIGGFSGLFTPGEILDMNAMTIPSDHPVKVVSADSARCNVRLRNTSSVSIALGGREVSFDSAVIVIEPGQMFDERLAPNVAWYAIAESGTGSLNGFTIQT